MDRRRLFRTAGRRACAILVGMVAAAVWATVSGGVSCGPATAIPPMSDHPEVVVFAAISLRDALTSAVERFQATHPGRRIIVNSAASGILVRQIELGAPADLFLSASPVEMDRLEKSLALTPGSRATFASNRLMVAVAPGVAPPRSFRELGDRRFDRIAIGNPRTVPAGMYARQALRAAGIDSLVSSRLILAESVRQVLRYVTRGEVAAGLVYRTEVRLAGEGVTPGPEAPAGSHDAILYQGAVPAGAPHPGDAREFLRFLLSEEGRSSLAGFGFLPPPPR